MNAFAACISLLFLSAPAWATSFYERPFPESVQDAPVIVRGKTGMPETDWAQSGDSRRIYTFWDLQVTEALKGLESGVTSLKMREIGGEKDGIGMEVSGAADFDPGEDVVVFLGNRNPDGTYDVWGMMMGKFNLQKDEDGQEYLVGPGINDLTHSRLGEGHGDTRGAKKWTLGSLRQLIESQKSEPKNPEKPVQKQKDNPPAQDQGEPQVEASESADPAAPQLHNSSSDEGSSPWPWVMGIGFFALAVVWVIRRRS